jgi:hypothetical protein
MIPSAVRDDDRRRPGTKPNSNRGSEARDRCPEGGKDVTEGELTVSIEPRCFQYKRNEVKRERVGEPTGCRERIVVGTQAQEKEERCEPDADPEEGRHVSEGGRFHHGPAAIRLTRHLTRLVCNTCEIEEPHEMVDDDKDAGRDE